MYDELELNTEVYLKGKLGAIQYVYENSDTTTIRRFNSHEEAMNSGDDEGILEFIYTEYYVDVENIEGNVESSIIATPLGSTREENNLYSDLGVLVADVKESYQAKIEEAKKNILRWEQEIENCKRKFGEVEGIV